ncbi:aldehyde dehydrogenase [Marinomonas pollencensis]|uniref:Lactaldehyde dehydrogenase/glycolaldehyde dehydrogenase n=1 Tax=Marinomonas pollencensis TaxID=491954 RepID=A0A3E0D7C4_9GAMM|nr:aldehyde dehydrogenase [Marinomonas pollencensis]REG78393.1 lactaldehyde dehydrogenase/glycolaldehyde dehydrogenase [Marinomonas pollencensis]
MKEYKMFVNGAWVNAKSGRTDEVINPATEDVIGRIQHGDREDANKVMAAAKAAQIAWRQQTARERATLMRAFAAELRNRKQALATLLVQEQGKLLKVALGEVEAACGFIEYACDWARQMDGDIVKSDNPNEHIWIHKVPRGVIVAITAWNFPLALAARKIGPALIAGNTIVVKPTTETPLATLELGYIAEQVGLPKGVLNIVTGGGRTLGDALVRHPDTKMVSMTGSTPAGQAIVKASADNLAHVQLELGGKAPFIVMDDADLEQAAAAALHSRFDNCGQVCTCNERMYIHDAVYDEFMALFLAKVKALKVGDPMLEDTDLGPKVNQREVEAMERLVAQSVKEGAQIATGGARLKEGPYEKGFWFEPTVLTHVSQDMSIVHEESFGPILPVIRFNSLDQVIGYANDSDYGLAAMVCTKEMKTILRLVDELEAGEVYINRGHGEQHQGFHNGYKLSGTGGEDGKYGFEQYLEKKTFYVNFD